MSPSSERRGVRPEHRDGLLAVGGLAGLVGIAAATVGIERLFDPGAAAAGVVGAVAVEVVFLRVPSRALGLWERRGVPVAGAGVVLAVGLVAARTAPRLLGVPVWGLVTYLVLLGCVLSGAGNPRGTAARGHRSEARSVVRKTSGLP